MWNKKIVITQHAIQRFEQRNITFSKYENNPARQILCDLKPMNVIKREHLYEKVKAIELLHHLLHCLRLKKKYILLSDVL